MSTFAQHLVNGVVVGCVYLLVAIGITMVYGLTRLINFAHGELVTLGALLTYVLVDAGLPYYLALATVALTGAVAGIVLDRCVFRFTRDAPINGFIVSLGLIAVFQAATIKLTDDQPRSIPSPIDGNVALLGVELTRQRLFVLAVVAAVFALFVWYLKSTPEGRATRAYAENPDAAAMMGVDVAKVVRNTFSLGGAQAALAGGLLIGLYAATPTLGASMTIKAFAVSLIGGLGSVTGALVASLGVGLSESLGAAYISSTWTDAFGYILMIAVLMFRPAGILRGTAGGHL
jgi:branched-chain amino acid transport system permease protein